MTPPVPKGTNSLTGTVDFDKYEDFILEEYMDMTYGTDHQDKHSGPVHPSHFNGVTAEDESLFSRNSEKEPPTEQYFGNGDVSGHHDDVSVSENPNAEMRSSTPKTLQECYNYGGPFASREGSDLGMSNRATTERDIIGVDKNQLSAIDQHAPPDSQLFMDTVNKNTNGTNSPYDAWVPQSAYRESSPQPPPTNCSSPYWTNVGKYSSDDSVSDALVIDEWPDKMIDERGPSGITPLSADDQCRCIHLKNAVPGTTETGNATEDLQGEPQWMSGNYHHPDDDGLTDAFEVTPWSGKNQLQPVKCTWPDGERFATAMNQHKGLDHLQEERHVDMQVGDEGLCKARTSHDDSSSQKDQNFVDINSHTISGNQESIRGGNVDSSLMQDAHSESPWKNRQMWCQQHENVAAATNYTSMTGFHDGLNNIQGMQRHSARVNHDADRETEQALAPGQDIISHRTAFEALASMSFLTHPCSDPNCPGDISRCFQEFPFPRRKTANRNPENQTLVRNAGTPSSNCSLGHDAIFPETFEMEPNQEQQRLLLRRMRNREAAKRCRKKKKQEFIALLLKRAMLLAEYHRCYHTFLQNE